MWQKSKCDSGLWLHDWLILRQMRDGLEEYCYRCGKTKLFSGNEPNEHYLSYHLRMSLKPSMAEFYIEYPNHLKLR